MKIDGKENPSVDSIEICARVYLPDEDKKFTFLPERSEKAASIPKQCDDVNHCSRCGEVCTENLCGYCAQIWKNIDTPEVEQ